MAHVRLSKRKHSHVDPEKLFRQQALAMAEVALRNASLWAGKKEISWALTEAQRAVKLLEVAR
jgi:hypothetical protein